MVKRKRTYKIKPGGKYRTYKRSSEDVPLWKPMLSGLIAGFLIIAAIMFFTR